MHCVHIFEMKTKDFEAIYVCMRGDVAAHVLCM